MKDLAAAIVQDSRSGQVLMLGWVDESALAATRETGFVHFWSRSRDRLWKKGETSGHTLRVQEMTPDCDGDAWLIRADPAGPICHTGNRSCFGDELPTAFATLDAVDRTIVERARSRPVGSYTAELIAGGVEAAARKVAEEAIEVLLAATNHAAGTGSADRVAEEAADLIYHLLVLLAERSIPASEVLDVMARRRR